MFSAGNSAEPIFMGYFCPVEKNQRWEFTHRFLSKALVFLQKNERMSDSLKKTTD